MKQSQRNQIVKQFDNAGGSRVLDVCNRLVYQSSKIYSRPKIADLIQESFRLKQENKNLLEVAKQAVEIAIEQDEQTAQ